MKRLASFTLLAFLGTAAVVTIPKNSHATTPQDLFAQQSPKPTPTPTSTPTPTPTSIPTQTPLPLDEPSFINKRTEVTPSPTPTSTPIPTRSPAPRRMF